MFVKTIRCVALSRVFDETDLVEVRGNAREDVDLIDEVQITALEIHIPLVSPIVFGHLRRLQERTVDRNTYRGTWAVNVLSGALRQSTSPTVFRIALPT